MKNNVEEWNFKTKKPAPQPREHDVISILEDYHEAIRQGGVAFDEIDEEIRRIDRAVGAR